MTTNREQGEKLLKEAEWIFERISKWLAEARAPSFYGERDFTSEDSQRAYNDAAFVLREIIVQTRSIEK
jgi:hypothetical protein